MTWSDWPGERWEDAHNGWDGSSGGMGPFDRVWNGAHQADGGEDTGEGWNEAHPAWPLGWRGLSPRERWWWFEKLWADVCMLRERYRLAIRAGWWENELQLEALAALAAWVSRYDAGEWDDPPGKLGLLYDLERVAALLRDGLEPFTPHRDRSAFERHLIELGCEPPRPGGDGPCPA